MIRLGFCSISALDRPLVARRGAGRAHGLAGIEVTARKPHLDPDAAIEAPARRRARCARRAPR